MKDWIKAVIIIIFMIIVSCIVVSAYWDASAVACGENETICRVMFVFR
jgi:hypothetical protein